MAKNKTPARDGIDKKKQLGAKKQVERKAARDVIAVHTGKNVADLKPKEQLALLQAILLRLGICDVDGVIGN